MHNPSISILGPGPDVMLIEGFDCIPYFSSVCSLSESNSCSYTDRAHNLKKRDANHWEKGELGLTYAPCMDTYTNKSCLSFSFPTQISPTPNKIPSLYKPPSLNKPLPYTMNCAISEPETMIQQLITILSDMYMMVALRAISGVGSCFFSRGCWVNTSLCGPSVIGPPLVGWSPYAGLLDYKNKNKRMYMYINKINK